MSLFKRINDNIRANLNALLDNAEDPVKLSNQYLRDMEDDIADAESAVARHLAAVRKLQSQYDEAAGMAEKREKQAMEALQKNREDLARKALADKKIHQARAEEYKSLYENSYGTGETLKSQLRQMKQEYDALLSKRDALLARTQAAKARQEIHRMKEGFGKNTARSSFDQLEDKVRQMEAEVQVMEELGGADKSLDDELSALSEDTIEKELAALKARIAGEV